jgi:hypothetical protein
MLSTSLNMVVSSTRNVQTWPLVNGYKMDVCRRQSLVFRRFNIVNFLISPL